VWEDAGVEVECGGGVRRGESTCDVFLSKPFICGTRERDCGQAVLEVAGMLLRVLPNSKCEGLLEEARFVVDTTRRPVQPVREKRRRKKRRDERQ
jgi:hypothetical protein